MNAKIMVAGCALFLTTACTSHFGDKEPDSQYNSVGAVDSNLKTDEKLDQRLFEIEDVASRIRDLLNKFRKITGAKIGDDVYTQLDFLVDINQSLSEKLNSEKDGRYSRSGEFKINLKGLSEECRTVKTLIETEELNTEEFMKRWAGATQSLVYSIKTCNSGSEFIPVLRVVTTFNGTELQYMNENLQKAMKDTVLASLTAETGCQVGFDADNIVSRIECKGFTVKVSDSEHIVVDNLLYTPEEEMKLVLDAKIFENDAPKTSVKFTLDKGDLPNLQTLDIIQGEQANVDTAVSGQSAK